MLKMGNVYPDTLLNFNPYYHFNLKMISSDKTQHQQQNHLYKQQIKSNANHNSWS